MFVFASLISAHVAADQMSLIMAVLGTPKDREIERFPNREVRLRVALGSVDQNNSDIHAISGHLVVTNEFLGNQKKRGRLPLLLLSGFLRDRALPELRGARGVWSWCLDWLFESSDPEARVAIICFFVPARAHHAQSASIASEGVLGITYSFVLVAVPGTPKELETEGVTNREARCCVWIGASILK